MTEQGTPAKPNSKTLYDSSVLEIMGKNFLAGLMHALGGVVIQIGFLVLLGYLAAQYLWPQIEPMMTMMNRSINLMEQIQGTQPGGTAAPSGVGSQTVPTEQGSQSQILQQLLKQYQQVPTTR